MMKFIELILTVSGAVSLTFFLGLVFLQIFREFPTRIHFTGILPRRDGGEEGRMWFKTPSVSWKLLSEVFDLKTATWLLLRSRTWSEKSAEGPFFRAGNGKCNRSGFWYNIGLGCPSHGRVTRSITRALSDLVPDFWFMRMANAEMVSKGAEDPMMESPFVAVLAYKRRTPGRKSLFCMFALRETLERIAKEPDMYRQKCDPIYRANECRPFGIRYFADLWAKEKADPLNPNNCCFLLEL